MINRQRMNASAAASLSLVLLAVLATPTVVASASAASPATSFHVVPAKKAVTDSHGQSWVPDSAYAAGGSLTSSGAQVSGTSSPALYRNQRAGMSGYAFPVSTPGTYSVVIYLAELGNRNPGQRVYDVTAEGVTVASRVDVANIAGKNASWHLLLTTPVTDGVLNLGFIRSVDKPTVGAIAVEYMHSAITPTVTLDDEFDGQQGTPPDSSRWTQLVMFGKNQELNYYTDHNAYADGAGDMVITAKKETITTASGATRDYTSGRLATDHLFSYEYGRAEARILTPPGQGLWPAWWAIGADSAWPASGEIDAMEELGQLPTTDFGTVHGITSGGTHWQYQSTTTAAGALAGSWHDYASVWQPDAVETLVDGRAFLTVTPADLPANEIWPFDKPFWLRLDLSVGGTFAGAPSPSTVFPAEMKIDWVRVTQ